jgi:hypothetical protein
MWTVPWWAMLSSGAAPVLLVGGAVAAASLQPAGYDPLTQTISALAADGATDRWLMTGAIGVVGLCYIVTALGLYMVRAAGRLALVFAGLCSILLAFSPEPGTGGTSLRHLVTTGLGFTAMALWPCLAAERDPTAPWALRLPSSSAFTMIVAASAAWFLLELHDRGEAGLAERVVTGLQTLWPMIVVACLRRQHLPSPRVA